MPSHPTQKVLTFRERVIMLTIETPMGVVVHNDLNAAIDLLRASVENGFPIAIDFRQSHGGHSGHPAICHGECGV
jgi:hypothetical protein